MTTPDPLDTDNALLGAAVDDRAGAESESEAAPQSASQLRQAFVTASDWTAATVLQQLRNGNIDLSPRFQRREVWQPDRKSRFVESVLLGLPIPQVVLAELPGQRGRYIVLDGKQRLLTLRQFCSDTAIPEDEGYQQLSLRGLRLRPELNGKAYLDLRDEPGYADDRDAFDNGIIRTVVVRNAPSDDYLFLVFLRLNTESVALSPQELRQALQPGPFTEYVDERALESEPLQRALRQSGPDFRMRDTEVLLRAVAFSMRPETYAGNLKKFLDHTCQELNGQWDDVSSAVSDSVDRIEKAISATLEIFGDRDAFSRYADGQAERRFNRAVYDCLVHSLAQTGVTEAALRHSGLVEAALQNLCATDRRFVSSITSTTKSIPATAYRFAAWADALQAAIGTTIEAPADYRDRAGAYKPA